MPDHRLPYGDAFIIGTPKIDELSNRLYAEERQRRLYKQQQDKSLDDEFKNILPGIRSADVPKLANLWGDMKQSWIDLRRNPPKNQADYLRAQQSLLQKQAAVYQHVAGSKERGQDEKKIGGLVMSDKTGLFDDKAHSIIKQGLSQPYDQPLILSDETGQEKAIDWTDPDQLKSHIDTKYVSDAINKAQGDRKATYIGDKEKDTDLQMPKIQAGNNPFDFYSQGLTKAAPKQRDFLNTLPHPTDDEYNDTLVQYGSLDPAVKKMWKMKYDLPEEDQIKTPLERAMKYQAMKYGINPNNQPRIVGYAKDEALELANKQKFAKAQQQRSFTHAELMQRNGEGYREAFKKFSSDMDTNAQEGILNKQIQLSKDTGSNRFQGKEVEHMTIGGKDFKGVFIDVPKSMIGDDAIKTDQVGKDGKAVWSIPDRYYLTDDKKFVIPVFLGSDTKSGGNYIKPGSTPIPIHLWKQRLAKDLLTRKETGAEVVDDSELTNYVEPETKKTTSSETHTISTNKSMPIHARDEFKAAGWSDEQINKAVKAGKISLK